MNNLDTQNTLKQALEESLFEKRAAALDWPVLEQYAETVLSDPDRWIPALLDYHDRTNAAVLQAYEDQRYEAVGPAGVIEIPCVLGLVGPRLDLDQQERVAEWTLGLIKEAIEGHDDFTPEVMTRVSSELGEGAFNRAAQSILDTDPDDEELWQAGWFEWWTIAERTVGAIGQSPTRQSLDDWCRQHLPVIFRRDDVDELEWLIWYMIRSDRHYVANHVDAWIDDARGTRPNRPSARSVTRYLKEIRRYLQGDGRLSEIYDHHKDFRDAMDGQAAWLAKHPDELLSREEESGSVADEFGSIQDELYEAPPLDPLVEPIVRDEPRVARNDPCPCGSGKKYKKCCLA